MWEAIAANQRRSFWLISLMGAVLAVLGALIGLVIVMYAGDGIAGSAGFGRLPLTFWQQVVHAQTGAWFGIAAAMAVWLIMWVTAAGAGDTIVLKSAGAHEIQKDDAPQLWNIVEEMTIASGLKTVPRVFIIDDPSPNAFAVGLSEERAAVAVTAGLMKRLNRDELQGVIAHEVAHIRNLDVRFMTLAAVMVGTIALISHVFLRRVFYGSLGRRRSSRDSGVAWIVILVVALVVAILGPIAAQVLYFACSRRREFLADASAVRFTRYPLGLASALEKISERPGVVEDTNKVVAPMYIVNPLQAPGEAGLLATHPSTEERIHILRSMGGAGFAAYETAYQKVHGVREHCIGPKTLTDDEEVAIRKPSTESETTQQAVQRAVAVGTTLERLLPFGVITCACGVKLKLPPNFARRTLKCPRCGLVHAASEAQRRDSGGVAV